MAQVASDRLDQMQDPELGIEQALTDIIYRTWARKSAKEYKQFKGGGEKRKSAG